MLRENEKLKTELEKTLQKEKHQQQLQILQEQNKISAERYAYPEGNGKKAQTDYIRLAENREQTGSDQTDAGAFVQPERKTRD